MAVGVAAEVKSKLSVVDVVGESVPLKKAGSTFKGLCPFHGEKTPSFTVTPARDSWKCFGCGEGGDIFTFVMKRDGLSFPEALKVLASKAGVELDERTTREDARKKRLRDVLESAIAFYHAVLTASKTGQAALDYLRGRGFTDETIARHQLGFAPGGWDTLTRQLAAKRDVRPDELVEVGLAQPRRSSRGGVYDRFRERAIFPIRDANGSPVGLGGRILESAAGAAGDGRDHGPKYLNSPATPLFDKSRTLYLIDRAKGPIRKSGQAVIVEGYTDALMAHQAGFDNVVASLGTALTPGQIALLTRYAKRIALAYDVDAAGEKAGTFGAQALEVLIGQLAAADTGVELDEVRVVRLPDGKDPDEVVREAPDRWREEVRTAQPIVDYLIDFHARQVDLKTPGGKARFVDAIAPTLRAIPNPVMRDAYLQTIHTVSGIEERSVLEILHRRPVAGDAATGRITADAVLASADALPVDRILGAITPVEEEFLRLLLLAPDQQARTVDEVGPDQLPSQPARELFRAIVLQRAPDDHGVRPPFSMSALIAGLDDSTRELAQAILAKPSPDLAVLTAERIMYAVDRCLLQLERRKLDERADWVAGELLAAEGRGDRESVGRLVALQLQNNEARRSVDRQIEQATVLVRA
ncbi:MAG TPA: DNA primase [Candidatus Limnocylindrales bacterium]|nr:DNA primase [Candidatus Limnocylindrales bacterium]